MAVLPHPPTPTIEAIYATYKNSPPRAHLGGSQIGENCTRKLWYSFRHCLIPTFEPRMLRLFETGFIEESRIIDNLHAAGFKVWSQDPDTGRQFQFKMFGGHYSGSLDGIVQGIPESKVAHVLECKTASLKNFKVLQKKGVQEARPLHYAQVQQYMGALGLERALYICCCKDDDSLFGERIRIDKAFVKTLEEKAHRVIFADSPLDKLGDSENSWVCKFCDYKSLCWSGALPEINCRTCAMSTPEPDGGWSCARGKVWPDSGEDCRNHAYIPGLVPLDVIDADPDAGTITYSNGLINGFGKCSSHNLRADIHNSYLPDYGVPPEGDDE